jgi:hypothetical protein
MRHCLAQRAVMDGLNTEEVPRLVHLLKVQLRALEPGAADHGAKREPLPLSGGEEALVTSGAHEEVALGDGEWGQAPPVVHWLPQTRHFGFHFEPL